MQIAETREKQQVLAAEIIKGVLLPQFAILPLAILLSGGYYLRVISNHVHAARSSSSCGVLA